MRHPFLTALVLLLAVNAGQAADIDTNLRDNAVWQVYTNRQMVRALLPTADGVWVGTEGGLELRDAHSGQLAKVFTTLDGLPDNAVAALLETPAGALWVGTEGGGLAYYDGAWTVYQPDSSPLPNDFVTSLALDRSGRLWVGTADPWAGGGLAMRDSAGQWQVFSSADSPLPDTKVYALEAAADGGVWIGTEKGLAYRSAAGVWQAPATWPQQQVRSLLEDRAGNLWLGTLTNGLARRAPDGTWIWYHYDNSDLPDNWIESLSEDAQGNLWIGMSWEGGLAVRTPADQWQVFQAEDSPLPADFVPALAADGAGGMLIGTERGVARRTSAGRWDRWDDGLVPLPHNTILSLLADAEGGTWIGTEAEGGLVHFSATGEWTPAPFYFGAVNALVSDGANGLWAANNSGLVHYPANGDWLLYNRDNTPLPDNYILALARDSQGGLWVGSGLSDGDGSAWDGLSDGGLAYRDAQGAWKVYTRANAPLPGAMVRALATDNSGGVWIGLWPHEESGSQGGLVYRRADGTWESVSALPGEGVRALLTDNQGGLWVGLDDPEETGEPTYAKAGLWYRNSQGQWTGYTTANSDLPDNRIQTLLPDGEGGLWVGASGAGYGGGLMHFSAAGEWTELYVGNSGLPSDWVTSLQADSQGGLWIGTGWAGLAHLGFGEKTAIVQALASPVLQSEILQGRRAAILIQARGLDVGYSQAQAVEFMAGYVYHSLHARGYDHDEIYFLSPQPDLDFNADATADTLLVDAPVSFAAFRNGAVPRDLSVADVEQAFAWAKNRGTLDQPLLVIFVDHGIPGGLLLDPMARNVLDSGKLSALLDEYQNATGNAAIVILEACHSGSLAVRGNRRIVVSSTDGNLAYYGDLGRLSFVKLYFDRLRQGDSFAQALTGARSTLAGLDWPFNSQQPQFSDGLGGDWCVNGCWGALPGLLTLTVETPGGVVMPGATVDLSVQPQVAATSVQSMWAAVITPRIAAQRDAQGYSRLPAPVVNLRRAATGKWQGNFSDFSEQGDYVFTVKARDHQGFVTEAAPLRFSVAQGPALNHARFDQRTGILDLPAISVTDAAGEMGVYRAQLLMEDWPNLILRLATLGLAGDTDNTGFSSFAFTSGLLHVPTLQLQWADGRLETYGLSLDKLAGPGYRFQVDLGSLARH